jgi:glutaconate CoA-transferase subunit B
MILDYSPSELMAVSGARELQDHQVVAVGLGLPVVASFLAKQTHAPNMTMLFELGVIAGSVWLIPEFGIGQVF